MNDDEFEYNIFKDKAINGLLQTILNFVLAL